MLSIQKTQVQLERERKEQPEQVEALQEELELEKEKKEIISSLYNDWIYEYNVRELLPLMVITFCSRTLYS